MAKKEKDINLMYSYVFDYINEAVEGRESLKAIITRATLAYKKKPSVQLYRASAMRFYQETAKFPDWDGERRGRLESVCTSIPDGTDDSVFNAIETVTSMAMGGVGQFQCVPYDKYLDKDEELIDRQEMYLEFAYADNNIDSLSAETVRKLFMQGQFNYYIKPVGGGKYRISLIDAYRMLFDPRRAKSNRQRFIGFTEVDSWSAIKSEIYKDGKDYRLKVINDVDQYIAELNNWGNIASGEGRFGNELSKDLDTFASIYLKKSESKDKKGNPVSPTEIGYKGDDVEIAYLWDIDNKIFFKVINRRFIVSAKENPLSSTIEVKQFVRDDNGDFKEKTAKETVELDSPIVHVGLINADWETYPISPLWYALDDFDKLCAKQSIKEHNFSIMAPITFVAASYDAEILSSLSQVAGQIAEGTSATMGVLNKTHDMSPILRSIEDSQQSIKRMLGATDQYELMQLLNNRATGAEVSMANAAVSQRMNIALAKLEEGHKELMQKILKLNIIDNDQKEFYFPYKDGVSTITNQELLATSITQVRLKSRVKVEMQEQSRNALMILQTITALAQSGAVDIKRAFGTLLPRIMQGTLSRREAIAMVSDDIKFTPRQVQEIISQQEQARQARDEENRQQQVEQGLAGPIPEGTELTPDELAMLEQYAQTGELPTEIAQGIDELTATAPQLPGQLPTAADGQTPMPQGLDPVSAGQIANSPEVYM